MFPRAVHANGSSLGGVLRAVEGHLSARHQERELQEVSFIQGNLAHHLLVDYLTHRRSVGWNQRGCRINNYGLGNCALFELRINAHGLVHV